MEGQKMIKKIKHQNEEILNFAVHNDLIATFTKNNLLRLQIADKVLSTAKLEQHIPIDMQFDAMGNFLALGCQNGHVVVYKTNLNNPIPSERNILF